MSNENRKVVDCEFCNIDFSDAPDFCDAYIEEAYWDDNGFKLTDDELDELNDSDERYELLVEYLY